MSKDSSPTNIHMHHPRLADYFEDFTRPHTSHFNNLSASTSSHLYHHGPGHAHTPNNQPTGSGPGTATNAQTVTYGSTSPALIPSYLPIEDIYVLPQYQPPNPEDEDDVVPDQHAAFGITRAMERRREPVWRDLGLEGLVDGRGNSRSVNANVNGGSSGVGGGAGGARVRVRGDVGRRMGGRRVVCLR